MVKRPTEDNPTDIFNGEYTAEIGKIAQEKWQREESSRGTLTHLEKGGHTVHENLVECNIVATGRFHSSSLITRKHKMVSDSV